MSRFFWIFRTLEELGVVAEIKSRILHPLGLSLKWNEVTNIGEGCEVCANGMWNYTTSQDILRKRRENFNCCSKKSLSFR